MSPTSNHFDSDGKAHMVDVSAKEPSRRLAVAGTDVRMSPEAATVVREGTAQKGDVLGIARIAGINATKSTPQLIPLCHAIPVESARVEFEWLSDTQLRCRVTCVTTGKTGIEMEALTGASVAALTVYDMLKAIDRTMEIGPLRLLEKDGGKSGHFSNPSD
ncbi:MAG: cyclic pyranopterin monophosphate synthase MoaC [Planctomycetota bacterium]